VSNGKGKNASSAGAANPIKALSDSLIVPDLFLDCLQQLNKNQTSYSTAIQAQNLITINIVQYEFIKYCKYFLFLFNQLVSTVKGVARGGQGPCDISAS